jgi:hypothetical protein
VLANPRISFVKRYVARDLADLRAAFVDDLAFASAVAATTRELLRAREAPETWGTPLRHGLSGWRRSAFSSTKQGVADLRLIFRPRRDEAGIDVLMFGPRYFPDATSLYRFAAQRTSDKE